MALKILQVENRISVTATDDPYLSYLIDTETEGKGYEARVWVKKLGSRIVRLDIHLIAPVQGQPDEERNTIPF